MESQVERLGRISREIDSLIDAIKNEDYDVVKDGIVDIEKYCNSKYKILWVLKEANDPNGGGWNMREGLKRIKTEKGMVGRAKPTFEPIIYTSYGILNDCITDGISYIHEDPSIVDVLNSIAFINVKKIPGGAVCNANDLNSDYKKHRYIVLKQIIDYEPDIVIFGGTDYLLTKDLELFDDYKKNLSESTCWIKDNKLFIRAYHPQYYKSEVNRMSYCDEIINAVREWRSQLALTQSAVR